MNIEKIYKKLGKHIKEERTWRGITQVQLAKRIGISRPSLANIEVGRQRVFIHQFRKIEKGLGLEKNSLLSFIIETGV